ncbi:MAG: GAF domain-containing protein, partial [Candidatus Binatia bacterium]
MSLRTLERPLTRPVEGPSLSAEALLGRVALALNSTLELREVLRLLAEITLDATGADRCSLFLLEGFVLRPAVAIGWEPQDELWAAFREMGPIDLRAVPSGWERLAEGSAVGIEDAQLSDLVPPVWAERFELRSLVLVPLLAQGEPCGLMAVDYRRPRPFGEDELRLLEAIGSYAGVAVRNARLFEGTHRRARLQEALARGMAALASPLDPARIAHHLVDAYVDLLGARVSAIGLFDPARKEITTVAARGTNRVRGPIPFSEVPEHIVTHLWTEWTIAKRPVEFGDEPWFADVVGGREAGACWYLVLPLVVDGHSQGVVLLGFDAATTMDVEERCSAEALAGVAAAALERTALLERLAWQVGQLDVLHRMSIALSEGGQASALVAGLNDLLSHHGIHVAGVAFRDRSIARRFGGAEPTRQERQLCAHPSSNESVELPDGNIAIPMRLGRHVIGTLRVGPAGLSEEKRAFVEVLAREMAAVASRAALRAAMD